MAELFNIGISEEEKRKYIYLIQNEYDWDKIAKKTLKVYEEIL